MNPIPLYPGMALAPTAEGAIIDALSRILEVRAIDDRVVLIHVDPNHSSRRTYFTGQFTRSYSDIQTQLNPACPCIAITTVKPRADATASAAELDQQYRRPGCKQSYPRRERRRRWHLILPLIRGDNETLLFDSQLREEAVARRAREVTHETSDPKQFARTKREIKDTLNQYWAGGSTRGALTPLTGACGGRGKIRACTSKPGRKNRLTRQGIEGVEGFIARPHDQDIIQFCWRNYYTNKTTEAKACRKMWREFYSIWETDASGRSHPSLLKAIQRPTPAQFRSWGQKQSPEQVSWRKQLASNIARMMDRAMLGNANDGIYAVGQRGSIDSTSPDMKFVSSICRIDRIGSAYRILIVDALHGYIPGFYLGLEAPSAETVKLAVLHAMTPKGPWLQWLGLTDQDLANWIPIQFTSFIADNTDARADKVFVSLDAIGSGSLHVPVARSDLNSLVEVGHHQLHRLVDHNMHGTTQGEMRTERGETSPDEKARHTILEGIRETARAIYAHNTMPLDIEPTAEMRDELLNNGIPITRATLTALSIRQSRVARSVMDIDEARIHLMPITRGTFTRKGASLLRKDTGKKRKFITSVTYVCTHKSMLARFREAAAHRGGRDIEKYDGDFRYNPYDPTAIYFREPQTGELISLTAVSKDRDLLGESVYADILQRQDQYDLERPGNQETRDQIASDMEHGQERTKESADAEYNADINTLEKTPSKATLVGNKTENREREKALFPHGAPTPFFDDGDTGGVSDEAGQEAKEAPSPTAVRSPAEPKAAPSQPARKPPTIATPRPRSIFSQIVTNQLRQEASHD